MPVWCCNSSSWCFHNMKLKGCRTVLVWKACWHSVWGQAGLVPSACWELSQYAPALSIRLLTTGQNCGITPYPAFKLTTSTALFSTIDSVFKSMCILVTVFPSSFYFLQFKPVLPKCPSQKWYTRSTSAYVSFPRTKIFSVGTTNTDIYTWWGNYHCYEKLRKLHLNTVLQTQRHYSGCIVAVHILHATTRETILFTLKLHRLNKYMYLVASWVSAFFKAVSFVHQLLIFCVWIVQPVV